MCYVYIIIFMHVIKLFIKLKLLIFFFYFFLFFFSNGFFFKYLVFS